MGVELIVVLTLLIFVMAFIYSAVGHGGASGYLAVMALLGLAPVVMKPTALTLNVLVSSIALWQFYRTGAFSWRLFVPLALASVPCAYFGGLLHLPTLYYKPLIALVLLYAAWRSFSTAKTKLTESHQAPSNPILLVLGACLGGLSGLTGVGGGIFLSPVLLFFRWAPVKTVAGISAAFILLNSIAGLAGVLKSGTHLPVFLPVCLLAAGVGGWLGASFGSQRLSNPAIQKMLGLVLLIAAIKMTIETFS